MGKRIKYTLFGNVAKEEYNKLHWELTKRALAQNFVPSQKKDASLAPLLIGYCQIHFVPIIIKSNSNKKLKEKLTIEESHFIPKTLLNLFNISNSNQYFI